MFKPKTAPEPTALDLAITRVLSAMADTRHIPDDHTMLVDTLVKLQSIKDAQRPERLSKDAIATITANLMGILLILNHERAGIVTSKALSFVSKLR